MVSLLGLDIFFNVENMSLNPSWSMPIRSGQEFDLFGRPIQRQQDKFQELEAKQTDKFHELEAQIHKLQDDLRDVYAKINIIMRELPPRRIPTTFGGLEELPTRKVKRK
jgi:peptidoglycan hydrolase CwlO-like protein